ncbi:hypothetical protein BDZ45DRAFT_673282 [Acephala macrosclerotiorum]|nr:hypothetical protein BDZ45DRAFT_673282 [Acephala macrosclerotiorum]
MMIDPKIETAKNNRVRAPKSKNGCVTCKFRHKKCDESRPACTQCTKTGRTCDFLLPTPPSTPKPPSKRHKKAIKTLKPLVKQCHTLPQLIAAPTFGSPFLSHELPHFEYFHHLVTYSSSSPFRSPLFTKTILQFSHHEPCIRHAIIAISALLKYQSRQHHPSINVQSYRIESHVIYARALEGLNRRIGGTNFNDDSSWEVALIGNMLIATFEALGGRDTAALNHLETGGELLKERLSSSIQPSSTLDELTQAFTHLNVQACTVATFYRSPNTLPPFIPSSFPSLLAARRTLDSIIRFMWHALRPVRPCTQTLPYTPLPPDLATKLHHIRTLFTAWESRFNNLILSLHKSRENDAGINVLRIQYLAAEINLETEFYHDELAYDAFLSSFREIVDLSTSILFPGADLSTPLPAVAACSAPTFAFESMLIPPLYLVALKCRETRLRRRAIALLKCCGIEGVWNGAGMAAVAEWIMEIEERDSEIDGDGEAFVREESRCRQVSTTVDRGAWRAAIISRRRLNPCRGNMVGGAGGIVSGIVSADGKWEYFGGSVGWGDGVRALGREEKQKEDELLFHTLCGWKADLEGLDFVLRMPDKEGKGKGKSMWMINTVDVLDLGGSRARLFKEATS